LRDETLELPVVANLPRDAAARLHARIEYLVGQVGAGGGVRCCAAARERGGSRRRPFACAQLPSVSRARSCRRRPCARAQLPSSSFHARAAARAPSPGVVFVHGRSFVLHTARE